MEEYDCDLLVGLFNRSDFPFGNFVYFHDVVVFTFFFSRWEM